MAMYVLFSRCIYSFSDNCVVFGVYDIAQMCTVVHVCMAFLIHYIDSEGKNVVRKVSGVCSKLMCLTSICKSYRVCVCVCACTCITVYIWKFYTCITVDQ